MGEGAATRALRESLRVLGPSERDRAAVQLAKRYAALLDAAAVPASYRAALDRLAGLTVSKADENALAKLREALSAHTVASDLGPKYLAVLDRLGLTPAARGAKAAALPVEPDPVPDPVAKPKGTRDELKQRRAARAERAAANSG